MSKGLKVTIIVISVIAALGIAVGTLWYTGFFEKEELDRETVFRYETDDGHIYTEAEWSWKPIVYQEVIPYMEDTSDIDKITIALSLDDDTFYDVTIPNKEYIYEFDDGLPEDTKKKLIDKAHQAMRRSEDLPEGIRLLRVDFK